MSLQDGTKERRRTWLFHFDWHGTQRSTKRFVPAQPPTCHCVGSGGTIVEVAEEGRWEEKGTCDKEPHHGDVVEMTCTVGRRPRHSGGATYCTAQAFPLLTAWFHTQ